MQFSTQTNSKAAEVRASWIRSTCMHVPTKTLSAFAPVKDISAAKTKVNNSLSSFPAHFCQEQQEDWDEQDRDDDTDRRRE